MDTDVTAAERGVRTPPYVAYKTFRNFMESLRKTMPSRIDRSVLHTMSGGAQSQMIHALRSMDLVTTRGIPTDLFRHLVSSEGAERRPHLQAALRAGYPFLFAGSINLATASGQQLLDEFSKVPISGDTVRRSVAFFLAAAREAGIPLSGYFDRIQSRAGSGKRAAAAPVPEPGIQRDEAVAGPPRPPIEAQKSLLLWGLFERLPKPGTRWPKAHREQWLQTLQNVLCLEYPDEE
jgi:hypothetical protein